MAAKLTYLRAVPTLLDAMARFPSVVALQQECCAALASLTRHNAAARSQVGRLGGINLVAKAAIYPSDFEAAQIAALQVICGIIGSATVLDLEAEEKDAADEVENGEEDEDGDSTESTPGEMEAKKEEQLFDSETRSNDDDRRDAVQSVSSIIPIILCPDKV